jgi:hypothetical protein
MGILNWLLGRNRAANAAKAGERGQTDVIVERVVQLSPHVRLADGYEMQLAQAAQVALSYIDALVKAVPPAREASAAAWSTDPYIHAFFGAPDDVAQILSRSTELRRYFDEQPDVSEVFAVLGMAMVERRVLGMKQEGTRTRSDVARITISFADHQVRACGRTDAELRCTIVQRVVEQLVLEGLAKIEADAERRNVLEQERALLKARRQLLERRGAGTAQMFGGVASVDVAELARLAADLDENERALARLGLKTDALERQLRVICDVMGHPDSYVWVTRRKLRLDAMNVVVEDDDERAEIGSDVEFRIARTPASREGVRAFSLVRFARRDLLPAVNIQDEARRLLI